MRLKKTIIAVGLSSVFQASQVSACGMSAIGMLADWKFLVSATVTAPITLPVSAVYTTTSKIKEAWETVREDKRVCIQESVKANLKSARASIANPDAPVDAEFADSLAAYQEEFERQLKESGDPSLMEKYNRVIPAQHYVDDVYYAAHGVSREEDGQAEQRMADFDALAEKASKKIMESIPNDDN